MHFQVRRGLFGAGLRACIRREKLWCIGVAETSRLADVVCVTLASAICAHEFMGTILQHVVRAAAVVAGPGP